MFENQIHCLVVVIAVFLPPQSDTIDQDFTNPGSSSINFDNFGLAELAKQLAEASELEEKFNYTEPGSILGNILLNATAEASTTVRDDPVTNEQDIGLTVKLAEIASNVDKLNQEEQSSKKNDNVDLVKDNNQVIIINEHEQSNPNPLSDSTDAYKVLEKREADAIERPREINSTLVSSEVVVNSNVQPEMFKPEQTSLQDTIAQPPKLSVNDLDGSRKFRDVDDDLGNSHTVDEKLQLDQNSLFIKNQPTLVSKPKNRCSCEDRMQKVVPDGSSFIELGGEREEDDTIRKIQGMLQLIDSVIETAGSARKELGLCRKSKLADAACLLTNDEDKMEKAVLQIVSCVKDAMKDQLSPKCCIPLPRELHSFLIWLMHGSEGGGMIPPTIQEGKSKPSYLFHEDNHRPHIGANIYETLVTPSACLLDLISSNKALPLPVQVGKSVSSRIIPPEEIDQSEPNINMQSQYEVENSQNNNINNQYLGGQQNGDLPYQRKLPLPGRNFYRPLRSLSDANNMHPENDLQSHEQAIPEIRDPMEELINFSKEEELLSPSDSKYEKQSRNSDEYTNSIVLNENSGKTIIKRDLSGRKSRGNKYRDDYSENKFVSRKKKRKDGAIKFKPVLQDLSSDAASSTECSLDVQSLLQPSCWNEEINMYTKDKKEKRKEKKRTKCVNRKDTLTDDVGKYNVVADSANSGNKEEKITILDPKNEVSDQIKSSDLLDSNSKSNYDDSSIKFDLTEVEEEPDIKSSENKPKKKKHKNNKSNSNKEKHSRKMSTETPTQTGQVNMNLSDFQSSPDLVTVSTKKNNGLKHIENSPGSKSFQVSISSKKSKQNKFKPSIVFEDDLADSHMEIEEEEYLEPEYAVNDADEYESYTENDPIDLYYDSSKAQSSKCKSASIHKKEVKKKYRETRLKNKGKTVHKKNRTVKKKKKISNKKNERNQLGKSQNTPRSDTSQSRGGTTQPLTTSTPGYVDVAHKENLAPSTATIMATSTDSGIHNVGDNKYSQDNKFSQENPSFNKKTNQENKEVNIEANTEPSKNDQYRLESLKSEQNKEANKDAVNKLNKDTKYDKTSEEKQNSNSGSTFEEIQSLKDNNRTEEKQNKELTPETEEKKHIEGDNPLNEKNISKSESQSQEQKIKTIDKDSSKYDSGAEEKQTGKGDITPEDKQSSKYDNGAEEKQTGKGDITLEDKQSSKYDNGAEEKQTGKGDITLEDKQNSKYDNGAEEKQTSKDDTIQEDKISSKYDEGAEEKQTNKGDIIPEDKQNSKYDNGAEENQTSKGDTIQEDKQSSRYDSAAEEKKTSKGDTTLEEKHSSKYGTELEESDSSNSEITSEENQTRAKNLDKEKFRKSDPQNFYTVSITKGKICSKDVSKNKLNNRNNFRNGKQKKLEPNKKVNKAVSKSKDSKFEKYSRTRVIDKKKSQMAHDQDREDFIISKVRNKKQKEEDDEIEEDLITNEKYQEQEEEDTDEESDDDDNIVEIKPKNQMCVDEDRSLIDPDDDSDKEAISNYKNFFESKPIKIKDKPSLSKKAFLKIINSPEIMGGDITQDSLLNVTNILKGISGIGEDISISTFTTITESNVNENSNKGNFEYSSEDKMDTRLTESTMVKLSTSTAAPRVSEPTDISHPAYNTYKPNTTTKGAQLAPVLTLEAGSNVFKSALPKQPTNVNSDLEREIINLPLDSISFENSLQTLF